ncbi:Ig-like domain-containing protein, partial [Desulfobacterales bacterium HSG17]|nr:Ig-like domain-containing protein [Desulfobacterales bacterium HSG17]
DFDTTDALGIAIISADNTGGTWQFDEDGGEEGDGSAAYFNIQISTNEALLLRDPAMIRFLPDENFSGDTGISFRAWDKTGGGINGNVIGLLSTVTGGTSPFSAEIGAASLSITPVNDPPVIEEIKNYIATEKKEFAISVKANEPDGDTIFWSFGGAGIPSGMTISDTGSNTAQIQWTPGEGALTAAIEVIVRDNENPDTALFDTKSFTITVNTVNDPPRIVATPLDFKNVTEGIAYEYEVLVSDPEDNRTDMTWALTQNPPGMTIDASGVIRWTPEDDELSSTPVTIKVTDTGGLEDTEAFTISVNLVNDAPAFISTDSIILTPTNEDVTSTGTNVSNLIGSNINDPDGPDKGIAITKTDASGQWEYSQDGGVNYLPFPLVSETQALLLSQTAVIRFIPAQNFFGDASISFRAWDQSSGAGGDANINTNNNGGSTSFSISQQIALITINPINDRPLITASDPPAVNEDAGPKTISKWAVFSPGPANENDLPDPTGYKISNIINTGLFAVPPAINTDGELTYTPAQDANGTSTFDLTIKDDGGTSNGGIDTSSVQTFTMTINPVNDAPILENSGNLILSLVNEDNPGTAVRDVLLSDSSIADVITDKDDGDPEGIAIVKIETDNGIWQYKLDMESPFQDFPGNIAEDNAVLLADTAIIRFVPDSGFNGTAEMTFRAWDLSDGNVSGAAIANTQINGGITAFSSQTETILFAIEINTAPVGLPDSYSVDKGSVLNISAPGVLSNDNDPDNDSLTAELVNNPSNGEIVFDNNGSFSYTPNTDFTGQDTFSYKALDSSMESQETQVTITINQPPDPTPDPEPEPQPPVIPDTSTPSVPSPSNNTPEVAADNYTTDEDTKLAIDAESGILANDSDPDKDKLAASIVEKTSNGELTLNNDGSFIYTPAKNFSGTDIFTYSINDGTEDSAIAAVTLTINPVNDRPVITGQSPMFFKQDTSFNISLNHLEANDPDNKYPDDFTLGIYEGENYTIEGSNITPLPGVTGTLIVPVTINDGQETSEPFNLNIGSGNLSDKDGDGMPDDWEWEIGLNFLANDANEDPDGDGYSNIEEYNCNTDPTSADFTPNSPEVYAGPDQTVSPGMTACLNGVHSFDSDGTIKSYEWVQKTGTPVSFDPLIPNPCFTAHNVWPGGESLRFDLIVTDDCGLKVSDTCIVNITWSNGPPKAKTGQGQSVQPGSEVILDASLSSEPDDGFLTYKWEQTKGKIVNLLNPNSAQASFLAPDVKDDGESLKFLLTVTDNQGLQSDSEHIINILKNDLAPAARADSPSDELTEGNTYRLEGKKSGEPGETIIYRWRQLNGPPVTLSDITAIQPTFVLPPVDAGAVLEFELIAKNSAGLQNSELVKMRVKNNGIAGFPSDAITFLTESDTQMGIKTDESSGVVSLTSTGSRIDLKIKVSKPGDTATAVIFMKEPVPDNFSWYAFTSTIGWYKYNENAVLNEDRTQLTLTITDGGREDENSSADGIINFLSGPEVKEDLDKPDDNINIDNDDKDLQDKPDDKDDKDDIKDTGSDGGSSGFCFIGTL